ncbi:MAG: DUF1501 domain-containing protein [bacterium]
MNIPVWPELNRRQLIQLSGGLGLHLGGLWQVQARAQGKSPKPTPLVESKISGIKPVKACILVFYYGGPSHIDTYDLKPDAPAEVRGEFRPIASSVPGLNLCEHLPRMARLMHKVALVRSVTHQARLHDSASIHALTGRPLEGPDRELFEPQPQTTPSMGGALAWLNRGQAIETPFAALPSYFRNVHPVPCQGGGFLGSAFDPIVLDVDVEQKRFNPELFRLSDGLDFSRVTNRRQLLDQMESISPGPNSRNILQEKAYRLLNSKELRHAMDLTQESDKTRERYGFFEAPLAKGEGGGGGNGAEMGFARQMRGQNLLMARRLVEAGVPFVNVNDFRQQGQNWDAHFKCFNQHKSFLLPQADQGLSALIEDLDERGMLDETLVVAMGEFGRTPKINNSAGRDHWPDCYTVLFAGGGVTGGAIFGASDRQGAYPAKDPVTPGDIAATIYWRFGFEPDTEIFDQTQRPHRLAGGNPIKSLFGVA